MVISLIFASVIGVVGFMATSLISNITTFENKVSALSQANVSLKVEIKSLEKQMNAYHETVLATANSQKHP